MLLVDNFYTETRLENTLCTVTDIYCTINDDLYFTLFNYNNYIEIAVIKDIDVKDFYSTLKCVYMEEPLMKYYFPIFGFIDTQNYPYNDYIITMSYRTELIFESKSKLTGGYLSYIGNFYELKETSDEQ